MPDRRSRIQCLDRALDILEALMVEAPLSGAQLAARLGLNASTVHNIVSTLAARGYLTNDAGRYRVGPGAAVLAGAWDPVAMLPRVAAPYLESVVEQTGESAVLTVLLGETALMVAFAVGPGEVTAHFPRRHYPYPLTIATGRTLVAHADEAGWPQVIARHRSGEAAVGDEARWSFERWREELRSIRETGIAEFCRPGGVCAVAVPVAGPGGTSAIASLGVSCPAFRADEAHRAAMRASVLRAGAELSAALGVPPEAPR